MQMRPSEVCNTLPEPQYHGEKGIMASSQVSPLEADRLPKPHDEGEKRQHEMAPKQTRPLEAPSRPSKPNGEGERRLQDSIPVHQRPLEAQNELLNPHHQLRMYHKLVEDDSWPSVVSGRPPRTAFEHKARAETQFQHNQGPSDLPKRPPSIMRVVSNAVMQHRQAENGWFVLSYVVPILFLGLYVSIECSKEAENHSSGGAKQRAKAQPKSKAASSELSTSSNEKAGSSICRVLKLDERDIKMRSSGV